MVRASPRETKSRVVRMYINPGRVLFSIDCNHAHNSTGCLSAHRQVAPVAFSTTREIAPVNFLASAECSPLNIDLSFCVLCVQFDYDNGVGSKVDRFSIDLYTSDGTGDCGTFVTSICDKEAIGCKDSSEFSLGSPLPPVQIDLIEAVGGWLSFSPVPCLCCCLAKTTEECVRPSLVSAFQPTRSRALLVRLAAPPHLRVPPPWRGRKNKNQHPAGCDSSTHFPPFRKPIWFVFFIVNEADAPCPTVCVLRLCLCFPRSRLDSGHALLPRLSHQWVTTM